MKLRTLIFVLGLLAAGCAGPGGRPITEELTLEEINGLLKKDPEYQTTVMLAETFREKAPTPDKAKATELTYDRLHKFLASYYNADVRYRLQTEGYEKWAAAGYAQTYDRADSLIAYWQDYLDENKPDSYVKVSLAAILPANSRYGSAEVLLDITPLKGSVDKVEGSFGLFKHGQTHSFGDFGPARHNRFSLEEGLRAPVRQKEWMGYSIWDITDGDIAYNMFPDRPGLPVKELLDKYDFDYTITTLIKEGKPIRFVDVLERIPMSVRSYWSAGGEKQEQMEEYYYTGIVQELVDPDFIPRSEYISDYEQNYYRELDPLAAWLMLERFN